ncbi:MAG: Ferric uptake regulator, Fur family [Clostridia bacterium 41_269]|nr:MAG: Ferric uptake regulator, Fur family [Clostridia bacterium 41_269]
MVMNFDAICSKLKNENYKITPQREIIIHILLNNEDKHLSAEEIYDMAKKINPDVGMTTIYRTLDLLVELGVLQKLEFGDGRTRYELNNEDMHHHHHLICLKCGEVQEFEQDLLEALEEKILEKKDFLIVDHKLKFYGICRKCR